MYILRVDDVGQDITQADLDVGMTTFAKWYAPWRGMPVYCGIVPQKLTIREWDWLERIPKQFHCIHGWDHAKAYLSFEAIRLAKVVMPYATTVIPPFNWYHDETFSACISLGMRTILGGFDKEHHVLGEKPMHYRNILHIPANRLYYDKAEALAQLDYPDTDELVHIVMHHRWDADNLDAVKRLRDKLEGKLCEHGN